MEIKRFDLELSVCKVADYGEVNLNDEFVFTGKTDDEFSLVCLTKNAPQNTIEKDDGWKIMRVQGVLDFSLIGVLAKITTVLAENKIGVFAISTYNTDYILVKKENYDRALQALDDSGYNIVR